MERFTQIEAQRIGRPAIKRAVAYRANGLDPPGLAS
jgi:hypothetical protein